MKNILNMSHVFSSDCYVHRQEQLQVDVTDHEGTFPDICHFSSLVVMSIGENIQLDVTDLEKYF